MKRKKNRNTSSKHYCHVSRCATITFALLVTGTFSGCQNNTTEKGGPTLTMASTEADHPPISSPAPAPSPSLIPNDKCPGTARISPEGLYQSECVSIPKDILPESGLKYARKTLYYSNSSIGLSHDFYSDSSCRSSAVVSIFSVYDGIQTMDNPENRPLCQLLGTQKFSFAGGLLGSNYVGAGLGSLCSDRSVPDVRNWTWLNKAECLRRLNLVPGPSFQRLLINPSVEIKWTKIDSDHLASQANSRPMEFDESESFKFIDPLPTNEVPAHEDAINWHRAIILEGINDSKNPIDCFTQPECPAPPMGCKYNGPVMDQSGCVASCGELNCDEKNPKDFSKCGPPPSCAAPPVGCNYVNPPKDKFGCSLGCGDLSCSERWEFKGPPLILNVTGS